MSGVYGICGFNDSEVDEAVQAEYGHDPVKLDLAKQVGAIAGEFSHAVSASGYTDVMGRREYRKKCRNFITAKAKETIPKPVGCLSVFIFWAVLSGLVSWFTQKLMHKYFDDKS